MKTLDKKVVVVTGAGSGIGRAVALACADRGSALAISDVNETGLQETATQLRAKGAEVHVQTLDVADRGAFAAYASTVKTHFGRVNVIVNNAGVTVTGNFDEMEYADFEWIMGINFWGVVNGTKEFLPHLIESGDGHVVNISSLFGLVSMPGQSAYNASKYAVRGFTEALREELIMDKHRVGVSCVHPGGIKTGIARNGRKTASQDASAIDEFFDKKLARMTPDNAAEIIVRAILKNQARVLVGADAHAIHHSAKLLGSRYQDIVAVGSRRFMP